MHGRSLADALAAARRFVSLKPTADKISIVSFASSTIVESSFSSSTDDATAALEAIRVDSQYGTTLYDAIVQSAHELNRGDAPGRVIVLVTDGQETTSKTTLAKAIRAARSAHASGYPVAIESATFSPAPLRELAQKTGGAFYRARSSHDLNAIYATISDELRRTWRVDYLTTARPGDLLRLHVTVPRLGSASAVAHISGAAAKPASSSGSHVFLIAALVLATALITLTAYPLIGNAHWRIRWRGTDDGF
jgi:von Willebrand factor type A domain-containing protein